MNILKFWPQQRSKTKGNAWVGILVLLTLMSALGVALVSDTVKTISQSKKAEQVVVGQALVDAGIDKAIWKLNTTPGYAGENGIVLPTGTVDIAITNIDATNKQVIATSYVPSKTNPKTVRKVRANLTAAPDDHGIAFHYGVQVGAGGLTMNSSSALFGGVYSNGKITGYSGAKINGDAYAVGTISSPTPSVTGQKKTGQPALPLPALDLDYWRNEANANNDPSAVGITLNSGSHGLGPKRINGNLTLNGATLKLTGPLYVTGDFSMNSSSTLNLDSSFGSSGTVIVVDGKITLTSSSTINSTSANPKGYIMLATPKTGSAAVELNSSSKGGVFYAPNGDIQINSSSDPVAIIGYSLTLNSSSDITWDVGLASSDFTSGPGGSWVLKEWQIIH
jgi:hypothetical protein